MESVVTFLQDVVPQVSALVSLHVFLLLQYFFYLQQQLHIISLILLTGGSLFSGFFVFEWQPLRTAAT